MRKVLIYLLVLLLAQQSPWLYANDPLFQEQGIIELKLIAPFKQIRSQKKREKREWLPAELHYVHNAEAYTLGIKVRARGVFRRLNCTNPPLSIKFSKSADDPLFAGQKTLKLVTPCKSNSRSEQQVLVEELAYRSFNVLTDRSLRTRLTRITYVEQEKSSYQSTVYAFFIEDDDKAAARLGLKKLKVEKISSSTLDKQQSALVELYQLMIGNTDYSTIRAPKGKNCCHNIEIFHPNDTPDNITAIPYDFDMSGLVDAKYATPPDSLPIKNVRKRYFTGICKDRNYFTQGINTVLAKQNEILSLFSNSLELDAQKKRWALNYLSTYFDMLSDERKIEKQIFSRCRGKKP